MVKEVADLTGMAAMILFGGITISFFVFYNAHTVVKKLLAAFQSSIFSCVLIILILKSSLLNSLGPVLFIILFSYLLILVSISWYTYRKEGKHHG